MGSALTFIKNAIGSVKRLNDTISSIRQNIANVRKCSKDLASIVHDLNLVSHEVKSAVEECSSVLQAKICERIRDRLTPEDLEYIHHIVFYKEFVSHIEKMSRIDRGTSNGDLFCYLLEKTGNDIKQYKKDFLGDSGRFRLLAEMQQFLEINNRYELESFSLSEENDTFMTSLEDTEDANDASKIDDNRGQEEPWIAMRTLDKGKGAVNNTLRKRIKKSNKNNVMKLCKWRKKNMTEGDANTKCQNSLAGLLRLHQQLSQMLANHLTRSSYAEILPVKAFIIKNIIEGEHLFEIDNDDMSTPRMAKINSQLEKIIRKHDLTELNLKLKINTEINFKEALEIIDDAASKVHRAKDTAIEKTRETKVLFLKDIDAIGVDTKPGSNYETLSSEMLPFGNTLSLLKESSSKTIETSIKPVLKISSVIQNIQVEKIFRFADTVVDTAEYTIQSKQLIQYVLTDDNYETLLLLLRLLNKYDTSSKGSILVSQDVLEKIFHQLRKNKTLQKFIHDKLKEAEVVKQTLATFEERATHLLPLINEGQDLQTITPYNTTMHLLSTILQEKMKMLSKSTYRTSTEEESFEDYQEMRSLISLLDANKNFKLLIKGLIRTIRVSQESLDSTTHPQNLLIESMLQSVMG